MDFPKTKSFIFLLLLSLSCGQKSDGGHSPKTAKIENLSLTYPTSFTGPAAATLPPSVLARSFWPKNQNIKAVAAETIFRLLNSQAIDEKIEVKISPKPSLANWQAAVAANRAFRFAGSIRVLRSEDIEKNGRGWRRVVFDDLQSKRRAVEYSTAFRHSVYSISIFSSAKRLAKIESEITFLLAENLR